MNDPYGNLEQVLGKFSDLGILGTSMEMVELKCSGCKVARQHSNTTVSWVSIT